MMGADVSEKFQEEIERIKSIVGKYFSIYDVKVSPEVVSLYCRTWTPDISEKFEALRLNMKTAGYIPLLTYEGGEHIIHVQKKPKVQYRSTRVNLILLIATIITTGFAGMWNWSAYEGYEGIVFNLETLAKGALFFALPLLLILGIHELGHYFTARKHKVDASLPFFIPLPISPLGTLGAVISMREPIPNRKALMDIGAAGPICGLIVAIPIAVIGWYLTGAVAQPQPANVPPEGLLIINFPMVYNLLNFFIPLPEGVSLHPMAFAGWVGIFVTALNLLPAGQLDGGHIARASFGDKAKYVSYMALFFLLFLGMFYFGWLIIGLLIIFLGARHPPPLNDFTKLDSKRKLLGVGMAVIIVVSFVPVPFLPLYAQYGFEFRDAASPDIHIAVDNITAEVNTTFNYTFILNNTGNTYANISVEVDENILQILTNENWNLSFVSFNGTDFNYTDEVFVELNSTESQNVTLCVTVPSDAVKNKTYSIRINASMRNIDGVKVKDKTFTLDAKTQ